MRFVQIFILAVRRSPSQPAGWGKEKESWVGATATPCSVHPLGPLLGGRHRRCRQEGGLQPRCRGSRRCRQGGSAACWARSRRPDPISRWINCLRQCCGHCPYTDHRSGEWFVDTCYQRTDTFILFLNSVLYIKCTFSGVGMIIRYRISIREGEFGLLQILWDAFLILFQAWSPWNL